ncbi:MAG: hypothetical protein O2958_00085 [Gemmatimonadetes bacterium]|nr:hypothetical protein [Gemmatimonadota bacterium]
MNFRALLVSALTLASLSAAPIAAQSLTGTWEIASETQRGPQTMTFVLSQEGMALTGTVTLAMGGRRGGGGGGAQTLEISDGMVHGDEFSFGFTMTFGDNSITQSFSGTFEGDSMQGNIEGGRGGGRPFTGTRGG